MIVINWFLVTQDTQSLGFHWFMEEKNTVL